MTRPHRWKALGLWATSTGFKFVGAWLEQIDAYQKHLQKGVLACTLITYLSSAKVPLRPQVESSFINLHATCLDSMTYHPAYVLWSALTRCDFCSAGSWDITWKLKWNLFAFHCTRQSGFLGYTCRISFVNNGRECSLFYFSYHDVQV